MNNDAKKSIVIPLIKYLFYFLLFLFLMCFSNDSFLSSTWFKILIVPIILYFGYSIKDIINYSKTISLIVFLIQFIISLLVVVFIKLDDISILIIMGLAIIPLFALSMVKLNSIVNKNKKDARNQAVNENEDTTKTFDKDYSFFHNNYGKVLVSCKYDKIAKEYVVEYKTNNKDLEKLTIHIFDSIENFIENDYLKKQVIDQYRNFIYNDYSKYKLIEKVMAPICTWLMGNYQEDDTKIDANMKKDVLENCSIEFENEVELDKKFNLNKVYLFCSYDKDGYNICSPITYNMLTKEVEDIDFDEYN